MSAYLFCGACSCSQSLEYSEQSFLLEQFNMLRQALGSSFILKLISIVLLKFTVPTAMEYLEYLELLGNFKLIKEVLVTLGKKRCNLGNFHKSVILLCCCVDFLSFHIVLSFHMRSPMFIVLRCFNQ